MTDRTITEDVEAILARKSKEAWEAAQTYTTLARQVEARHLAARMFRQLFVLPRNDEDARPLGDHEVRVSYETQAEYDDEGGYMDTVTIYVAAEEAVDEGDAEEAQERINYDESHSSEAVRELLGDEGSWLVGDELRKHLIAAAVDGVLAHA